MIKILIFLSLSFIYLNAGVISVAVASNVNYAMNDILKDFKKKYPNIEVKTILGSSGRLSAQIRFGAPYELFMSADMKYPGSLYDCGLATTKPVVYAKGSLVLLSMKKRSFNKGITLLEDKDIKKIAIANPSTAPYGKAAKEALKRSGLENKIKDKIVYAQSVSQVVSYVKKSVDIGFVAKSALFSPNLKDFKEGENYKEVDSSLYSPIKQGMVILKNGSSNKEVKVFYDYILSKRAKDIFKRYGYIVW